MSNWYGQKNYPDIQGINGKYQIAQIGCLVTSFCNLLKRFAIDISPAELNRVFIARQIFIDVDDGVRDDLGWASITAYDGSIHVAATGGGGGWPQTNNAIVKFHYRSIQHPTLPNGQPNMIDHFCLVADAAQHLIVDSWDGLVKQPGVYGAPVLWASYEQMVPVAVSTPLPVIAPAPAPVPTPPPANEDHIYRLVGGDTITAIAQRNGYTAQELLDHNGLTWAEARNLPVGFALHLPLRVVNQPTPDNIRYEPIGSTKIMYVANPAGAEKWAFANVKKISDVITAGHVIFGTVVDIVAVAHVPIGTEEAVYYMDKLAFGDYLTTGKVTNTIGFSWADLKEGTPPQPEPEPAIAPEPTPEPLPTPAPVEPAINYDPGDPDNAQPNAYKDTYRSMEPKIYLAKQDIIVHEYDGRRPDRKLLSGYSVSIGGTFTKNSILYGRPYKSSLNGYWFGIPMDVLEDEAELYGLKLSLPEKVAMKKTSRDETFTVFLAKIKMLWMDITSHFKKK